MDTATRTIVWLNSDDPPEVEMPESVRSVSSFRRWVFSEQFPENGRIDFIRGRILIDMAADDLFAHNLPKTEITSVLKAIVKAKGLGFIFADGARVSCPQAEVSVEPDCCFVSFESVRSKRVRFRKSKSPSHEGCIEIVGPPDLIVEVVSDSSVRKDTQTLAQNYYAAGVSEYWLFDCRSDQLLFDLHQRARGGFRPVPPDRTGFRRSEVLGGSFRLSRVRALSDMVDYSLETDIQT